jgi:hypothetical protein
MFLNLLHRAPVVAEDHQLCVNSLPKRRNSPPSQVQDRVKQVWRGSLQGTNRIVSVKHRGSVVVVRTHVWLLGVMARPQTLLRRL